MEDLLMMSVKLIMLERVAVVTGSNKGIGFAIVKALCQKFDGVVYLTSRDEARGRAAVEKLNKLGLKPAFHPLEVNDIDSVIRFRDHIKKTHGGIDILINNAAIVGNLLSESGHEVNKNVININYYSILTIQELLFPLLRDNARVLNISSECGHLANIRNKYWIERLSRRDLTVNDINEFVSWYLEADKNGTFNKDDIADNATVASYRISKVALSALTKLQQKELEKRNISVNCIHPGMVRTDMTRGIGFFSNEQAAEVPVSLVLDPKNHSLRGAYVWYDGRVLDWYDYNSDYYFKSKTLHQ